MAANPATVVTSFTSMERTQNGTVTLGLAGDAQNFTVSFSKNALTQLFVMLTSLPPPDSGMPFDLAPLRALGVSPFGRTDGTGGLVFELPGGWRIPFEIPRAAIPGVRNVLDQVEQLLKAAPG